MSDQSYKTHFFFKIWSHLFPFSKQCPLIFCYNLIVYLVLDFDIQKKTLGSCCFFDKLMLKKPPNCKKSWFLVASLSCSNICPNLFLVLVLHNDEFLYQITKNLWGITAEPRKTWQKPEKATKTEIHLKTGKTLNGHNSRTVNKFLKKIRS